MPNQDLGEICSLIFRKKTAAHLYRHLWIFENYCIRRTKVMVTTPNTAPNTMVTFASISSRPFFFPPNNVSAPPAIDPDNPALFPDCRTTTAINAIAMIASKIINAVTKITAPPNLLVHFITSSFALTIGFMTILSYNSWRKGNEKGRAYLPSLGEAPNLCGTVLLGEGYFRL